MHDDFLGVFFGVFLSLLLEPLVLAEDLFLLPDVIALYNVTSGISIPKSKLFRPAAGYGSLLTL